MHLTRRVRSLLEYLFGKFQVFGINRTENYYKGTAPYTLPWKIGMLK